MVAKAAAVAAAPQGAGIAVAIIGGLILFSVAKNVIPDLLGGAAKAGARFAGDAAGAVSEGTTDFLGGFFGLSEESFDVDTWVARQDEPGSYTLTVPRSKLSADVAGVPTPEVTYTDRYRIPVDELPQDYLNRTGGILDYSGFENGVVIRSGTLLNDASIAADLGARLNDPFTGLYTDPFLGSLGGPSIQDAVEKTGDVFGAVGDFFGGIF